MNDPLAFLRRFMRDADAPLASADIPTLTRVAEIADAKRPLPALNNPEELVDRLVEEYLPIIEHELRRRLREQLVAQED